MVSWINRLESGKSTDIMVMGLEGALDQWTEEHRSGTVFWINRPETEKSVAWIRVREGGLDQ